ncbi:large-conductance mechanosensitive channel protein MscL [Candidatus Parcubacteria bacterium]|uniref:Large-conductance mechanosensitive channel n=1 Tax=Candidatus Kaiserbacteria bacterium CG10_big_fil_rev_8_21_14_0_10_47_16 TaxID=1974608 RepID=A0A2H0UGQ8_9BACT|nr:large-conductance mechanosensitive channel protein MscL [Candidatus Parcubacteria bacterium]PIR84866.1 MAG: large conductance mechanosensitive channel protein MscL [Candidatus Kaiserbacteria bacterium CG10_big_fil_rev_8_21_14_0_10_47_16]
MKSFFEEFKKFAMRGNVVDMAVGIVIGAAFGKIVASLVENIVTPTIGLVLGGIDLTSFTINIGSASIAYGTFLQSIIDFIIIAFAIFLVIKGMNKLQRHEDKKTEAQQKVPSEEVILLREIRDTLKKGE